MLTEATFRFFASSVKHPQKNSSAQNFILISAQNPLCHILQKKIFFLFRDFFGATRKVLNLKRQSWSCSDKLPHACGMENMPLDKVVRFGLVLSLEVFKDFPTEGLFLLELFSWLLFFCRVFFFVDSGGGQLVNKVSPYL